LPTFFPVKKLEQNLNKQSASEKSSCMLETRIEFLIYIHWKNIFQRHSGHCTMKIRRQRILMVKKVICSWA